MSRLKIHYTEQEIELNLYTTGNEFMTIDRKSYAGLYHRYLSTGEIYTGSTYSTKSKKLLTFRFELPAVTEYKLLKPKIKTFYKVPVQYVPVVTPDDIEQSFITRYFIKKINSSIIIEIDLKQFKDYNSKKIDPNLYSAISVNWVISGEINDTIKYGISTPGVKSINEKTVIELSRKFNGLDSKLINFTEYFIDTDFVVSPDIN